jgi:GAF domain-containing protein
MADQSALKRAFADYARTLAGPYAIGDVLYRLTDQMVVVLGVDGAGVSLGDTAGTLQFVTATDEPTAQVEQDQVRTGEGPCHDAFRRGEQVTTGDLEAEPRWPRYGPRALASGMRAAAGIPMRAREQRIGAVNLYSRRPREWSADALADAQLLADMATGYIVNARMLHEQRELADQLQHALDSRVVIEQAKGVLAERHGLDETTAFEVIRRHARSTNQRVHDVARALLEGRLRL